MKNKKKGFTLVELLVVIAILAILATVSILGYTSFTGKAKASNSEQELSQMKTMLLADWLDGFVGEAKDQIAITKKTSESDPKGWYEVEVDADKMNTFANTLKAAFGTDVDSTMAGKVTFVGTKEAKEFVKDAEGHDTEEVKSYTCKISSVVYEAPNGYTATWTINGDTIKADKNVNKPTSVFAATETEKTSE